MGKILLATDFSNHSAKAYKKAAEIAIKTESEIILVHILQNLILKNSSFVKPNNISINSLQDSETQLNSIASLEIFKSVKISTKIIADENKDLVTTINNFVEKEEIDLVILGTAGVQESHKSLASSLIRVSFVPVISISANSVSEGLKTITVATDFENVNFKYLDKIWQLQQVFNSHIQVLYINTPNKFKETHVIENEFELFVNNFELNNISLHVYNANMIEDGILRFVEKNGTDLLAVSTHGRTGLSGLLHKSHSSYIVGHAKVPVYVYNMLNDKIYYNTESNVSIGNYYI